MSSINSVGSNGSWMMQGVRQRPDAAKMAEDLFARLDTSGQGYISKTDLQSAMTSTASSSSATSSSSTALSSNVDTLFSQLDSNGDGKVTKQEFADTLKKLAEQLDNQFMSIRMNGGIQGDGAGGGMSGMRGMPPPPPPDGGANGGQDAGFTKDQLTSQLSEMGSSDSGRSTLVSSIIDNFDKADTNSDGKVSFREAMAFDQIDSASSSSTTSTTSSSSSNSSASNTDLNAKVMMQIMKLMQAYNIGNDQSQTNNLLTTLSVSA